MMPQLKTTLNSLTIGPRVTFHNLTMFPLLGGHTGKPDYWILDEALSAHSVRVTEVSAGGSVPQLKFQNQGEMPVLLLDGEELVGAKQNRVLNLTILAPARTTIVIPVSCVESGRWSYRSAEFAAAPRAQYAAGRAQKVAQVSEALYTHSARISDQGAVWADISAKAERLSVRSSTEAMTSIFEHHSMAIDEFVRALPPAEGQCGALFAINNQIVGLDLFDYPVTLSKLLAKLVRSYALDALDPDVAARQCAERVTDTQVQAFLQEIWIAESRAFPAVGAGEDLRLVSPRIAGGALVLDARLVHLCAFHTDGVAVNSHPSTGAYLARASARRRRVW